MQHIVLSGLFSQEANSLMTRSFDLPPAENWSRISFATLNTPLLLGSRHLMMRLVMAPDVGAGALARVGAFAGGCAFPAAASCVGGGAGGEIDFEAVARGLGLGAVAGVA